MWSGSWEGPTRKILIWLQPDVGKGNSELPGLVVKKGLLIGMVGDAAVQGGYQPQ